ncbi:alpha/beta-hydrolase [Amylocystis lapponica]|nr:alpha/beta-hydrolase [Amylocystis lapponica]
MLLPTLTSFLHTLLAIFLHDRPSIAADGPPELSPPLHFELRHFHAVSSDAQVLFHDVRPSDSVLAWSPPSHPIRTRRIRTHRPSSFAAFARARTRSMRFQESELLDWDEDELLGPDVERRETLLQLAKMTNNAYLEPGESGWYDLDNKWNVVCVFFRFSAPVRARDDSPSALVRLGQGADCRFVCQSYPFGWEDDADGFRGHVFATPDNSTVVLAIKGTSAAVVGGGGPTTKKDKFNDNLLFSCCCARVDWTWTTVCGCYRGGWKCDQDCLEEALIEESLFYTVGTNLYNNLTYLYPEANIWVTGHSLGGAIASLLGVTFGPPVVAIESPGEKMASRRLHLPSPPSVQHITHVYHTADPIAMGTCNGVLSSCALGGYAMESRCHLGTSIVYDTVTNLSWAVDIRTHTVVNVIDKILSQPWAASEEIGREVPEAKFEEIVWYVELRVSTTHNS